MERRIIPLYTQEEYAPTVDLQEELGEELRCLRERDCLYSNPFEDRHHHIFGEDLSEVEQLLRSHPDFISNVCRCLHQQIHRTWDRSEPITDEFGVGYLLSSPQNLGANQRRRLKQLRRNL